MSRRARRCRALVAAGCHRQADLLLCDDPIMPRPAKWLIGPAIASSLWGVEARAEEPGSETTAKSSMATAPGELSDEDLLKMSEGETITVFAERPDKPFDRDTTVRLTGEQLAARGATDLGTALALLTDVIVRDAGRGGSNIDVRGRAAGRCRSSSTACSSAIRTTARSMSPRSRSPTSSRSACRPRRNLRSTARAARAAWSRCTRATRSDRRSWSRASRAIRCRASGCPAPRAPHSRNTPPCASPHRASWARAISRRR